MLRYLKFSSISGLLTNFKFLLVILSVFFLTGTLLIVNKIDSNLGQSEIFSGYLLFSLILFLMTFNIRKRLSVLPIFNVQIWTRLHIAVGITCLVIFFIHTGNILPSGRYEVIIALLFYVAIFSGVIGYFLQKTFPRRLTETAIEIIYEKIPGEISDIREEIESIITECTKENNSDTLARHYMETLNWFFIRPRFVLNHILGSQKGYQWIRYQFSTVQSYLNSSEKEYLDKIFDIAVIKNKIDFHYALQSCIKGWLFFHIPIALLLLIFSMWHLFVINVYSI